MVKFTISWTALHDQLFINKSLSGLLSPQSAKKLKIDLPFDPNFIA
jgi:hypothetical protein